MSRTREHCAGTRNRHWQLTAATRQAAVLAVSLLGQLGQLSLPGLSLAQETSVSAASSDTADNRAQVLLQEVMPALAGTAEGAVQVAQAPAPGTTMTIRRSDVQRALAQAGMRENIKAADIPKSVKVSRESVKLTRDDLSAQAHEVVSDAVAPCTLGEVRYPSEVRVQSGPRKFRAEFSGLRSGSLTGALYVETGGREMRLPVIASLTCPPPEIAAGTQVIAIAQVGPVKATAPAEARQAGRIGEIIRITNRATGASLRARILSARTVEVLP